MFGAKPFCTLRMACHVVGQRLMILEFDDISSHATLKEIVDEVLATKMTNGRLRRFLLYLFPYSLL